MDVFATDLGMINFMEVGSGGDNISPIMKELYTKVQNSRGIFLKVFESCTLCKTIMAMIKPDATVEDIKNNCKQYGSQEWINQFQEDLSNCTASSTTTKLDVSKAYASLTACYDKAFLRLYGYQILANTMYSLFQSYKTWKLIDGFIIPSYEDRIKCTRDALDECAAICNSMIDLEILNKEHVKELQYVEKLLRGVKDTIKMITEDVKNKIAEAKRFRSNSRVSFGINGILAFFNGLIFNNVADTVGDNSNSGVLTKLSTAVQFSCAIGDLIHAGKANILVDQLEKQLEIIKELEVEQKRLSDVHETLSRKPVQV